MQLIKNLSFNEERDLFKKSNLIIENCIFYNGESPLKESSNIKIHECVFSWKYPIWYSNNISVENTVFHESARSGIWYTNNISIKNSVISAPKTFRRSSTILLSNVQMFNAYESIWNSKHIKIENSQIKGDYFCMNSNEIDIMDTSLSGNYAFDGAKNINIKNCKIESKDAFWNCENVHAENCIITGEYIGWNSKNVTFKNCIIESEQGFCYMEDLFLIDCKIIKTDLAFEYSRVKGNILTDVESIKNPYLANLSINGKTNLILNDNQIEKENVNITYLNGEKNV
ncbi:hypothetical protein SHELI_v1c05550 [Spiroplasma helicoides]|uniref:DUF3737 family protein n=1 Tax=Spiroplasma helicoides TaxID=216938 RepID=A0A1B3SKQ9_9MOLU|nr:DUF3737 family protein [Spiroplasma helicoides]AOG60506.1 hypothetical protein SHELI_v1c05550 [Spiroplasma helicoides]